MSHPTSPVVLTVGDRVKYSLLLKDAEPTALISWVTV